MRVQTIVAVVFLSLIFSSSETTSASRGLDAHVLGSRAFQFSEDCSDVLVFSCFRESGFLRSSRPWLTPVRANGTRFARTHS